MTDSVSHAFKGLGDIGKKGFDMLAEGMGKNITDAIVYSTSIGKAMQAALAATLESLSAQSFAYAIFAGAQALLDLAMGNFAGAASAGEAAAMFGVAGIVTAELAKAITPKAASAAGGFGNVPADNTLTYLHRQEMVLPADIATPLRASLRNGPVGSGSGVNFHNCTFSGVTKDLVNSVFGMGVRQARLSGARI